VDVRIGHTALTWGVLEHPERFREAIDDCAALGFEGIETGGRVYDWWERERPGELRQVLENTGVCLTGLFQFGPWMNPEATGALVEDARRWASAVHDLGGDMLMLVPEGRNEQSPAGLDDFRQMAAAMQEAAIVAKASGVNVSMHPHWGTVVESRLEIEVLLDLLKPGLVGFAPDTGQIAKGGTDPAGLIARWVDRVAYVHLKDLSPAWDDMRQRGEPLRSPAGYAPLGEGVIDFRPILQSLQEAGYQGWLMAELDEASVPAREAAMTARTFLDREVRPGDWS
jgi:inosose dehydratase